MGKSVHGADHGSEHRLNAVDKSLDQVLAYAEKETRQRSERPDDPAGYATDECDNPVPSGGPPVHDIGGGPLDETYDGFCCPGDIPGHDVPGVLHVAERVPDVMGGVVDGLPRVIEDAAPDLDLAGEVSPRPPRQSDDDREPPDRAGQKPERDVDPVHYVLGRQGGNELPQVRGHVTEASANGLDRRALHLVELIHERLEPGRAGELVKFLKQPVDGFCGSISERL